MIETLSHPAQSAEFLSRLHDGELSPAEAAAFESHRRECAECRASVVEFERALAVYRSAPVPPHASDLSARILRKIRATSPSRRPFGVMFGIDVRWAGALAAALLVVIIGAPVFSRWLPAAKRAPAPAPAPPPSIPVYVLDAPEEPPVETRAQEIRPSEIRAAPKAEARAPESKARTNEPRFSAVPPEAEGQAAESRRDEAASGDMDLGEKQAAPETRAPTLDAAAPPAAGSKEANASLMARRQSAAAPAGGEAGAEEPAPAVRLTIQSVDGEGQPPELVRTPSDERLAALRGRQFLLVVESGGRVRAVEERTADKKLGKDKAREADDLGARDASSAESVLRELVFHPGDRSRRLVIDVR